MFECIQSLPSRLLILAISWLLFGCTASVPPPTMPPPTVSVAQPILRSTSEIYRYTGRLQATERVEVRARVKGFLKQILFREGVEVKEGTALYAIDPRTFQAEVDHARAEVARLEVEYQLAEKDADRVIQARSRGAVSVEEYDRRVAIKAAAAAALLRGKARLEAAILDLSFTRVVAPIQGRVSRTRVTVGNLVGEGEPTLLTTLVRMDPLYLLFEVTERDLLNFANQFGRTNSLGQNTDLLTVRFALDTDEGFPREAVVDFRETEVNPNTGTILIRAVVPNPDRSLAPGLFARVEVAVPRSESIPHIPEKAIGTDQLGHYVFVIDREGKSHRQSVTTGPKQNGFVAIERGLTESDQVVISGQVKIRPGMSVVAKPVLIDRTIVSTGGVE